MEEGYRYEGETNEFGQPHGQGIEYYPDGSKTEIEYKDGERHGREIRYRPKGSVRRECRYKDGKRHGQQIHYHRKGSVRRECGYKDGERHGQRIVYYPDGMVRTKTEYKNGERHGQQIHYHQNGSVRTKTEYSDGVVFPIQSWEYHPDGSVRSKAEWEKQEEQGEIVLSPLEEKERIITRFKTSVNILILAVALIPIVFILWSQTQVDEHPDAAWSGLRDEHTPLMLNALEALDVNNCIDGLLGTGLHQEVVIYCHELVDSTKQKITTFLILGVISALFLNHKIEKKNEEIAQMQDSILEMEEQ